MRIVIIGASKLGIKVATEFIHSGHQVLMIEKDKQVIDEIKDKLDCGFLHGDGSQPELLREADPGNSKILLCLSDHDQSNIIASLVARHMGYKRVVTMIEQESYASLCEELGLEEVLIPTQSLTRRLQKIVESQETYDVGELDAYDAGLYSVNINESMLDEAGEFISIDGCQPLWVYRNEKLIFPHQMHPLQINDQLIVLAKNASAAQLKKSET